VRPAMIRIAFVLLISIGSVMAEISTGIDTLHASMFDFSCPKLDCGELTSIDIVYYYEGNFISVSITGAIMDMGECNYANVTSAPDSSDAGYVRSLSLPSEIDILKKHVFCEFTRERHYAKFRVVDIINNVNIVIEWAYQNDGTKNLDYVGNNKLYTNKTWGQLKTELK
jgi:hypothetical protein